MSLTTNDLEQIRTIVREIVTTTVRSEVHSEIKPLSSKVEALHNDVKEIYGILSDR